MIRIHEASFGDDLCRRAAKLHDLCFAKAWDRHEIAALLARPGTGLIEDAINCAAKPQTRGFVLFRHVVDEAEILTLCVAPSLRRCGIAGGLIKALKDHLQQFGVENLFLEVDETNHRALRLYRACGFAGAGHRKDYYGSGRHGLIMRFAESIEAAN